MYKTHNTKTFSNGDGTQTTVIYGKDVHYFDGQEYKDIDLNIKREQHWEFEYALTSNKFHAYFNDFADVENFTLAGFELINSNGVARWINFKMLDATPQASGYYGNTFTYKSVQSNVDLEYTVTPEKLKENIIVRDASALQSFTFSIKLDEGLRLEAQSSGAIYFIDNDTEEKLWEIAAPFAIDAEGKRTEEVSYLFGKQSYNGVEYDSITVTIEDTDFIENAVYPIEIDPTVSIPSTGIQDSHVTLNFPNDNYGQDELVSVGRFESLIRRGFYQFDLSSVPADAFVISANLTTDTLSNFNPAVFHVHEVLGAWDENTITAGNAPSYGSLISEYNNNGESGLKVFDIRDFVQNWANGGNNYGVMIKLEDESVQETNYISLTSTENTGPSDKPVVEIVYSQPPSTPSLTSPNGGETWDGEQTITWNTSTDPEGDPLQYELQYSVDDGNSWDNIGLVSGTSYVHDFTDAQETSTARLRIRAYDGYSYSGWDVSDGVFTIEHNDPPEAPTNLKPNGDAIDRSVVQRLSWDHTDTDNQSKAEIDWKTQGASTWNRIVTNSTNEYKDVNGNTFPVGTIVWRVRTYDSYGYASPWSAETVFTSADPSNAPTITAPTSPVGVSQPTIQWATSDQQSYQILIENSLNTVIWDTGEVISTNRARTSGITLNNGGTYTISVRVRNQAGLWTSYAETTVDVSYSPPANPVVSSAGDEGEITVLITNPTPTGTQPNVVSNSVYRSSGGVFIRIAEGLPPNVNYVDYTPASGQTYEYYVQAQGSNQTSSESNRTNAVTTIEDAKLSLTSDYSQYVDVELSTSTGGPERTYNHSVSQSLLQFAGRSSPVAEYGEHDNLGVGLSFILQRKEDMEQLRALVYSRDTLLYRDSKGRREFVAINELEEEDIMQGWYSVSVTPVRVSYKEDV